MSVNPYATAVSKIASSGRALGFSFAASPTNLTWIHYACKGQSPGETLIEERLVAALLRKSYMGI